MPPAPPSHLARPFPIASARHFGESAIVSVGARDGALETPLSGELMRSLGAAYDTPNR